MTQNQESLRKCGFSSGQVCGANHVQIGCPRNAGAKSRLVVCGEHDWHITGGVRASYCQSGIMVSVTCVSDHSTDVWIVNRIVGSHQVVAETSNLHQSQESIRTSHSYSHLLWLFEMYGAGIGALMNRMRGLCAK